MTLAEMETYFQVLLAETTSSSDFVTPAAMDDFINEGCQIFAMETKIIRPTYQEITLVTGDSNYDLNSDFLAITEGVFVYTAAGVYEFELDALEEGFKEIITNANDNGQPANYCIRGFTKAAITDAPVQNIRIDPPPSASFNGYLMRVYYAAQDVTLSSALHISKIPVQFHRGPVCLAVSLFKERDQEFEQAQYYQKKANYWINKAKTEIINWDRIPRGWRFAEGQYVNR